MSDDLNTRPPEAPTEASGSSADPDPVAVAGPGGADSASPAATAVTTPPSPIAERDHQRRWLTLAVVLTAAFMVLLDISIVVVAIPAIQGDLGASFGEVQLVIAGYQLAYAVVLITGGRLGDAYGRKRLFIAGMIGFTVASALCGAALSPTMLVVSRVLQGLMASLMFPQVLSVIQVTFPPRERAAAFGMFGAIIGLATIAGPVLGGLIIRDDITGGAWRFVFLVNVPVGIASTAAAVRLLTESRAPNAQRLDLRGVALASIGLFLLVYPLVEGRESDWPWWTFAMLAGGAVVLGSLGVFERRLSARPRSAPLVQTAMFRQRGFMVGTLVSLFFLMGIPAFFFTFSVVLQVGLGYTALHAGLTTVPFAFGSAVGSALSVRLAARLGKRILLIGTGLLILGMVSLMLTVQARGTELGSVELIPTLLACGLGLGCVIAPLVNVILAGVRHEDAGSASGVVTTVQQIGGAIGVALIGVIFFGLLGHHAGDVVAARGDQLRQTLEQAEPGASATALYRQVAVFDSCFDRRAHAKDPQAPITGCPTGAGGNPVAQVLGREGRQAAAQDFTDSLQVTLLFNIGVWAVSFVLIALLPDPPRRGPHGDGVAAVSH